MTTRQKEIFFALFVLLCALLFLAWNLWPRPAAPTPVPASTPGVIAPSGNATLPPPPPTAPATPLTPVQVGATNTARLFAERFGSYSTEADFENVEDVQVMATASFTLELENIAANARREALPGAFYGVSTRVLGATVKTESTTAATVEVLTQREEVSGGPTSTPVIRNQTLQVELLLEADGWKVNGFKWID